MENDKWQTHSFCLIRRKKVFAYEALFTHPLLPTAISHWTYQFSSDHWSQAMLSPVSTWMGDRLGTRGAVGNLLIFAVRSNQFCDGKWQMANPFFLFDTVLRHYGRDSDVMGESALIPKGRCLTKKAINNYSSYWTLVQKVLIRLFSKMVPLKPITRTFFSRQG